MIAGIPLRNWLPAIAAAAGLHAAAFAIWGTAADSPPSAGRSNTTLAVTVASAPSPAAGSPAGSTQADAPAAAAALPIPLGATAGRETARPVAAPPPEPVLPPEPQPVEPETVTATRTASEPAPSTPRQPEVAPEPPQRALRQPPPPRTPPVAVPDLPAPAPVKAKPAAKPGKVPKKAKTPTPRAGPPAKRKHKVAKKRRRKIKTVRAAQPGAPVTGRAKSAATSSKVANLGNAARTRGAAAGRNRRAYLARILDRLRRAKRFPEAARRAGRYGTASLVFTVLKSGRVVGSRIVRSSGHAILDRAALAMLRRASPMPPIPPGIGRNRISVRVPVRFRLR